MTPQEQINSMIASGELININDQVTMQIFDAQISDKDIAVFQLIGYSSDLDAHVTMNYCANMSDARRFGKYLIELADKYDPQTIEVENVKAKKIRNEFDKK